MAVTKIHEIKSTPEKSISYILNEAKTTVSVPSKKVELGSEASFSYIENGAKTEEKKLVSSYGCSVENANLEMQMTRDFAKEMRSKNYYSNTLMYHMIQSFSPEDDITPEMAHELGKQLADQFLGGKYEYVIATHVDKNHIHNHIIFNAVSFTEYSNFRSRPFVTSREIRGLSDKICAENNLSVIQDRGPLKATMQEWQVSKKKCSFKSEIRKSLNHALETSLSFEEFKQRARELNVAVYDQGKYVKYAFLKEINGVDYSARVVRDYTLGEGQYREDKRSDSTVVRDDYRSLYTVASIKERMEENLFKKEKMEEALLSVLSNEPTNKQDFFDLCAKEHISLRKTDKGLVYKFTDSYDHDTSTNAAILSEEFSLESLENRFGELFDNEAIEDKREYRDEVKVHVPDECIIKATKSGLLIDLPKTDGKLFVPADNCVYESDTKSYSIMIGERYNYPLYKDEVDQIIDKKNILLKGYQIVSELNNVNDLREPEELIVDNSYVRSISDKGVLIEAHDKGIGRMFITNDFIKIDKVQGKVSIVAQNSQGFMYKEADNEHVRAYKTFEELKSILSDKHLEELRYNNLDKKIERAEQKKAISDIKELADIINNDSTVQSIEKEISTVESKLEIIRKDILDISDQIKDANDIIKNLVSYRNRKPIFDQYSAITEADKQVVFENKHHDELSIYYLSVDQLRKKGVQVTASIDEYKKSVKGMEEQREHQSKDYRSLISEKTELEKKKYRLENRIEISESLTPEEVLEIKKKNQI